MKIFDLFVDGGMIGMLTITALGIVAIALAVKKGMEIFNQKQFIKKGLDAILFFGSLAFAIGILYQVIGMFQAFSIVAEVPDISPVLLIAGIKVSMIAPIYGFVVFILSYIAWFIYRAKLKEQKA